MPMYNVGEKLYKTHDGIYLISPPVEPFLLEPFLPLLLNLVCLWVYSLAVIVLRIFFPLTGVRFLISYNPLY